MTQQVIAMAFDAAYAPHAGAAIASVAEHCDAAREITFLMVHDGVPEPLQAQVQACAPAAQFLWVGAPPHLQSFPGRGYVSRATYLRLCLPELAPPDVRKVLYLDCDLIVCRDVRPLFALDLGGRPVGAVFDYWIDPATFAQRWGLERGGRYFNAGVLLLDLQRLRENGGFARAVALLAQNLQQFEFLDQDALNHAFWNDWTAMDPIWNVQRAMLAPGHETAAQKADWPRGRRPGIVHYTSSHKPWVREAYTPYAWLYHRARAATPFGAIEDFTWLDRAVAWWRWARASLFLRA